MRANGQGDPRRADCRHGEGGHERPLDRRGARANAQRHHRPGAPPGHQAVEPPWRLAAARRKTPVARRGMHAPPRAPQPPPAPPRPRWPTFRSSGSPWPISSDDIAAGRSARRKTLISATADRRGPMNWDLASIAPAMRRSRSIRRAATGGPSGARQFVPPPSSSSRPPRAGRTAARRRGAGAGAAATLPAAKNAGLAELRPRERLKIQGTEQWTSSTKTSWSS